LMKTKRLMKKDSQKELQFHVTRDWEK